MKFSSASCGVMYGTRCRRVDCVALSERPLLLDPLARPDEVFFTADRRKLVNFSPSKPISVAGDSWRARSREPSVQGLRYGMN